MSDPLGLDALDLEEGQSRVDAVVIRMPFLVRRMLLTSGQVQGGAVLARRPHCPARQGDVSVRRFLEGCADLFRESGELGSVVGADAGIAADPRSLAGVLR
ncbi:hypothetical protein [Streptomyces sp. NPDC005017]|uniref:hypothetical protein n=1 Tax=Streptomyces sp. NPDC005017 TaxID=3364706 RepID=UPI0036CB03E9